MTKDTQDSSSSSAAPLRPMPYAQFPLHGEHKRAVSAVSFAPVGTSPKHAICASASADSTVKLWVIDSVKTTPHQGQVMNPFLTLSGHARGINDVAWSPAGARLATASDDKTLRLWDAVTGDSLVEFRGHSNFVFCTRFNPQSNLLVSGSFDETVKLWDVRTGNCVSTLPAHSEPVTGVDLNRDGTCIVSASHDGLIRIWDTATGECLKTIYAQNNNPPVSYVKYSPNGKFILSGTLDSRLRLWNAATSTCCKTYSGSHTNHKYCISSDFMVSNPNRPLVVTGSETGDLVLYDLQTRQVQQVITKAHDDAVLSVSCHAKQEMIATGGMTNDKRVCFWAPKYLLPMSPKGAALSSTSSSVEKGSKSGRKRKDAP